MPLSNRQGLSTIGIVAGLVLAVVGIWFVVTSLMDMAVIAGCGMPICESVSNSFGIGLMAGIVLMGAGVIVAWRL